MSSLLVDTDVLIDHLRGVDEATAFLDQHLSHKIAVSVISRAEILAGVRTGEQEGTMALLELLEALPVTVEIADRGGEYRRLFGPSHGVLLPDALIAATASVSGLKLATRNERHYPMDDVTLVVPY
ncbi:type II toxin-antitoxin system VapC family toxin [Planctomycetota bacterium]